RHTILVSDWSSDVCSSDLVASGLVARLDLREQFQPLASQRGFQVGESGDVSTRAVEPRDEAAGNRIAHVRKDDWDRQRLPVERKIGRASFRERGRRGGGRV